MMENIILIQILGSLWHILSILPDNWFYFSPYLIPYFIFIGETLILTFWQFREKSELNDDLYMENNRNRTIDNIKSINNLNLKSNLFIEFIRECSREFYFVVGVLLLDISLGWLFGPWLKTDWRFNFPLILIGLFIGTFYIIRNVFKNPSLRQISYYLILIVISIYFFNILPANVDRTISKAMVFAMINGFIASLAIITIGSIFWTIYNNNIERRNNEKYNEKYNEKNNENNNIEKWSIKNNNHENNRIKKNILQGISNFIKKIDKIYFHIFFWIISLVFGILVFSGNTILSL